MAASPYAAMERYRWLWLAPNESEGAAVDASVEYKQDVVGALSALRGSRYDALVIRPPVMEWTAAELVEEALRIDPQLAVIVHDPTLEDAGVVHLIRSGAFDVWRDEAALSAIPERLEALLAYRRERDAELRAEEENEPWRRTLVGRSRVMQQICDVIRLVGNRRSTVLITGETGTGKEMVARALHLASDRNAQPFVAVNCSALPENLLEAELFGHVKGAFTGAFQSRIGRFEQANKGTLLLDEIAEMPLDLQAKLLRVLQEREFQRLGSSETIRVDVRVVAACNVDLDERIADGRFREDLYYRVNVVPLALAALRERRSDIPLLTDHFVEKICRQEQVPLRRVAPETMERLTRFSWPGNVRQLENAVEMAVALSGNRTVLYPSDFPLPSLSEGRRTHATGAPLVPLPDDGLDYEATVGRIELAILGQALEKTKGNKTLAADLLRLKRTTLTAKLKSLETQSRMWG